MAELKRCYDKRKLTGEYLVGDNKFLRNTVVCCNHKYITVGVANHMLGACMHPGEQCVLKVSIANPKEL